MIDLGDFEPCDDGVVVVKINSEGDVVECVNASDIVTACERIPDKEPGEHHVALSMSGGEVQRTRIIDPST